MKRFRDYRNRHSLTQSNTPGPNATFKYAKLRGKGTIRLLTISPGSNDARIVCQLQHDVSLPVFNRAGKTYDALSYCWGAQTPFSTITLDGQDFCVGPSLYDALECMRYPDKSRIVWIDAICINQGDVHERDVQVKLMQVIYGSAAQTVIWLGKEADMSNLAMDFISYQAVMEPSRSKLSMDHRWKGWTTEDDLFYIVREPRFVPVWEALFALCKREYWSRMWIVQEIALSGDPVVCCGGKEVKWVDFELVIGLVIAMIGDRVPGSTYFWHLTPLLEDNFPLLLEQQRGGANVRKDSKWLLNTLQKYRQFASTQPKDKVIGFLRLVDQEIREAVNVDSRTLPVQFYTDMFKLLVPRQRWTEVAGQVVTGERPMIRMDISSTLSGSPLGSKSAEPTSRSHGPLNILCSAGHEDLPTWVPDWSDRSRPSTIDNITGCRMRATDDLEPNYRIHGDKVLETGGYEFGALRWVSSSAVELMKYSSGTMSEDDEALIACVADAMTEAITAGFAGHAYDAGRFWRALVFDCFPTQFYFDAPEVWARMDIQVLRDLVSGKILSEDAKELLPSEYIIMLRRTLVRRKFAVTSDGLYVVVPEEAEIGDKVCVVWGCNIPLILGVRGDNLVLIGECYCDVLADGTWLDRLSAEECEGPRGTFKIY